NYRELSGLAYDFFNPYPESPLLESQQPDTAVVLASETNTQPTQSQNTVIAQTIPQQNIQQATNQTTTQAIRPSTNKDDSLQISKIGVDTAIVISTTTNKDALENDLNNGAVYYPGSVLPGQTGQIVVLGHSAPPNWPHIRHDYIFSDLNNLSAGDSIVLNFNHVQYTYQVTNKEIIQQGQDVPTDAIAPGKNVLTLVSCWPPGKNYKRIAVNAVLVP